MRGERRRPSCCVWLCAVLQSTDTAPLTHGCSLIAGVVMDKCTVLYGAESLTHYVRIGFRRHGPICILARGLLPV